MTGRPDVDIAGATAAHARLLAAVEGLTDGDVGRPSLLPGWTVGHVLSHLARNADSHARILTAAAAGDSVEQYAGGRPARETGIEVGARRPVVELVDDVRSSAAGLEGLWGTLADEAWDGHGFNADGERWPCAQLPFHRWREVEVHLVDLGIGPTGPTGPTTTSPGSCPGRWRRCPPGCPTVPSAASSPPGCSTGPPRRPTWRSTGGRSSRASTGADIATRPPS